MKNEKNTNTPDSMKNTPDTNTNTNTDKKEGRNTMNTNTEKNTAPETVNTNTEKTEKKEGKKNMKNKSTRTAPKKNTPAPADKKQVSLDDNIKQFRATLSGDVKKLAGVLNESMTGKYSMIETRIKSARETVRKDLLAVNGALSVKYYRSLSLFDIVKAGENVPAVAVVESEKDGKYTVKIENITVKPTLSGMKSAGVIGEEEVARVDVLRRVVAYVKSGNTATVYLTGNPDEKKDVPGKKVADMLSAVGTPSKNKARGIMTRVFKDLTGDAYKQEVFPKLYNEFENYITKRGKAWGTRSIVGTATANDMALEFAWMYFNGKTEVKYIAD